MRRVWLLIRGRREVWALVLSRVWIEVVGGVRRAVVGLVAAGRCPVVGHVSDAGCWCEAFACDASMEDEGM
jgi:hypothetical protein